MIYALRPSRSRIGIVRCVLTFVGCAFSSASTFWKADAYRTFASTNALEVLLVGLGAWAICRGFGRQPTDGHHFASSAKAVCVISATIVVLSLFTPQVGYHKTTFSIQPLVSILVCEGVDTTYSQPWTEFAFFGESSSLRSRGFVPNVAENKFLQDKTFNGIGIAQKLATLWLTIPGATGLATPAKYRVCASKDDIPTEWGMQSVFTAQKIEPVEPTMACAVSSRHPVGDGTTSSAALTLSAKMAKETPRRPSFASPLDRHRRLRSAVGTVAVALPLPSGNNRSKHENGLARCSNARTEATPRNGQQ